MLGDVPTIDAVAHTLDLVGGAPVVLDPVMVAESGAVLLEADARQALVARLVPRAAVVTPNLPEARELVAAGALAGRPGPSAGADGDAAANEAELLARAVHALGPGAVVVTGGHSETGEDLFFDGDRLVPIPGERHPEGAAHGSGCTHSSTVAARLAWGDDPLEAARVARAVAAEAVRAGLRGIGRGPGPVDALGLAGRGAISRAGRPEGV